MWRNGGSSVETWWFPVETWWLPVETWWLPVETWWFLVVVQVRTAPKGITDRITQTPVSLTIHYEIHKKMARSA